ncbi:sensor histidine kinase [Rhodohalobacter sp. 8-1]|uniref:sensor histidine kinase n=1 Tax=Rhodohalobacter sp. 8-1 TaxID=3131972 RepID=UPI0030EF1E25
MKFEKSTLLSITQNGLFWVVSFIVLLRLFTRTDEIRSIDIIYTALFHLPLLVGVVWNQIALKHFLEKGNRVSYAFAFLMAVIFIVQIYPLTFDGLAPLLFPDYYFITVYEWHEIGGIGLVYVSLSLLLHLASGWFKQQESIAQLAQLKEEKTVAELQALRARINPHFLFNSLNTIYGETLKKSAKAPKLVLELSDLLRYVVDHTDEEQVPLKRELEYVEKFIHLQKVRVNNPEKIRFSIDTETRDLMLPPLLLITFIENCFKHGSVSEETDFIHISIKTTGNRLTLNTRNSVAEKAFTPDQKSSLGLENARRRLELSLPGNYSLEYGSENNEYHLTLTMEL